MLSYNEVKERGYIIVDGDPYEVISTHVFRKQQRKPVNQTKLRNLITGGIKNHTFHSADNVEPAEIERKKIKFLYKKDNKQQNTTEYWFCQIDNAADRFSLDQAMIGSSAVYIKSNSEVDALLFDEKIIGVTVPVKVELKVVEAPPAVKGNTSGGATKQVVLETGAVVNVPIFITEGEILRINTETGEYVERVNN